MFFQSLGGAAGAADAPPEAVLSPDRAFTAILSTGGRLYFRECET